MAIIKKEAVHMFQRRDCAPVIVIVVVATIAILILILLRI